MNPYLDALDKKLLPRWKEISADGKVTLRELWDSRDEVLDAVTDVMAEAAEWNTQDKLYVIDAFSSLFDRWVKPIDIPWIPNSIEDMIKSYLKAKIIELIDERLNANLSAGNVVGSKAPK